MSASKTTITLTFGDSAENHVGMEQLGERVDAGEGFSVEDLEAVATLIGPAAELYNLNESLPAGVTTVQASVLVIRSGVNILLGYSEAAKELFAEQAALMTDRVDRHALMYGRVVNKHARWNLCFDDFNQEPSYEKGKGRVIDMKTLEKTNALYKKFSEFFGPKAASLKGEGNYYYDIDKCGIGFHGDSERRKVIGVRLGALLPLHYQWFYQGNPVGTRIVIPLNGGDIYLMSEKAVGTDWKSSKIYTLRHATGCDKFTTIK